MLDLRKKILAENRKLKKYIFSETHQFPDWKGKKSRYLNPGEYEFIDKEWFRVELNTRYGAEGITVFLQNQITLDDSFKGKNVSLLLKIEGEGCLSVNGVHHNGLDFNRYIIPLCENSKGNESYKLEAEINCKDFLPDSAYFSEVGTMIKQSQIGIIDQNVWDYLCLITTAFDYADTYPEEFARVLVFKAIYDSQLTLDFTNIENISGSSSAATKKLEKRLANMEGIKIPATVYAVGHSHIDVAWHWPIKETYRKTSRTFSSVLRLMEKYPNFKFSQSMPCLYEMVEDQYPELFAQISSRIEEGRWETLGSMYLEPDCNLISGESFVRQLMFGKQYWKEKFGSDSRICFLPDTFGFSPAMPQILKKAGTDYFFTSKLAWQETNPFPHSVFWWRGLDGSMVLSGMQQMHDFEKPKLYNGDGSPKGIIGSVAEFKDKEKGAPVLYLYGYGDGGGGVTPEMLDHLDRVNDIPLTPTVKLASVNDYFEAVSDAAKETSLAIWDGPLYFEKHRGTYTSMAKNKRNNRKSEFLYRYAELLSTMSYVFTDRYNAELNEGWRLILLNQFHDILPGTSVNEVYELSNEQYLEVENIAQAVIVDNLKNLKRDSDRFSVLNTTSWTTTTVGRKKNCVGKAIVDNNGQLAPQVYREDGSIDFLVTDIGPFGTKTYSTIASEVKVTDAPARDVSESFVAGNFRIKFNTDGEIEELHDIRVDRDILKTAHSANRFSLLEDIPVEWGSAWEVTMKRFDKPSLAFETVVFDLIADNDLYVEFYLEKTFSNSKLNQEIRIYKDTGLIEFNTKVDWNELHKSLRVEFPVDVRAMNAKCDCAFGHYEMPNHRTTSVDSAKFEICAHKWIDLSEGNYGVAILNDSIYGHIVNDSNLSLSLLRSPDNPAEFCDRGEHAFTYYLYPHVGDFSEARIANLGYIVNDGIAVLDEEIDSSFSSFVSLDTDTVIIETVKMSEDGQGIIIRCYEAYGQRSEATLSFNFPVESCIEINLLEEKEKEYVIRNNAISFSVRPFEIKSFKLLKK